MWGVWGMFSGGVWRRGVRACGVCAGRWGEKISLAALLSGYLGKSGHLPRLSDHYNLEVRNV